MKKILLLIALILLQNNNLHAAPVSVAAFVTADDTTVAHIEQMRASFQSAINSADGTLITNGSISTTKLDANANPENRWNEGFNDFVFTGLLPPTSASLTAGTAYVNGVRVVKDATSKLYTASKNIYVDLSSTGTYTYNEVAINAAEPSLTANSIRLAKVSTDSTKVLSVRDDRVTTLLAAGTRFKTGTFTRSLTAGTSSVAYTGLGFEPTAIIIFGAISPASIVATWGLGIEGAAQVIYFESGTTNVSTDALLINIQTTTGTQSAVITSFDNDGFTLTWTKISAPTGTATLTYQAFR